jgi:hypothetical protein
MEFRGPQAQDDSYEFCTFLKSVNSYGMELLLNSYGFASCMILAAGVAAMLVAVFLPKERRHEVLRTVGRWWRF